MMNGPMRVGLVILIALSIFALCVTNEAFCILITLRNGEAEQAECSFTDSVATFQVLHDLSVRPCGAGSGGGQGPGEPNQRTC